jgi:hypothetical protein
MRKGIKGDEQSMIMAVLLRLIGRAEREEVREPHGKVSYGLEASRVVVTS